MLVRNHNKKNSKLGKLGVDKLRVMPYNNNCKEQENTTLNNMEDITMTLYGVCYTTKEPVIYNKGSKYESRESNFLYVQARKDNGTELVNKLNAMLAEGVTRYELLDLTKIDHFYLNPSEEMY